MTDERISAPSGWTEADYNSDRHDVRQAKQPAVFEHASGDLAVFVRPASPEISETWRVEIGEGGREGMVDADTINEGVSDRMSAIEQAKEVMATISEQGVPESPTEVDWLQRLR